MKRYLWLCVFWGTALCGGLAFGADLPRAYDAGNKRIVLENEYLRFEIDPAYGGRISSFVDKRDGDERVAPGRVEGLCFDQFYEQDDPILSGLRHFTQGKPYEAKILESGPGRAAVSVGRASIATEGGVYNENYADLFIERTFTLESGSPVLWIKVRIENRAQEGRRPAYYVRSGYVLGKGRQNERYLRPSQRGIQAGGPDDPSTDQMIWDPAYGWTATVDTTAHSGVVWLMDASRLMMFYNSIASITGRHVDEYANKYGVVPLWIWDASSSTAVTAEWYYHPAFIPAGGFWETSIRMVSLREMDSLVHACDYFVADLRLPKPGQEGKIVMSLSRAAVPAVRITLSGEVEDLDSGGKPVSLGTARIDSLSLDPRNCAFTSPVRLPEHALFRFSVSGFTPAGKRFSERFEYLHNPHADTLAYRIPAPKLKLQYKPGVTGMKPAGMGKVLYLEGLTYERWGLVEGLRSVGADVREVEFFKRMMTTGVRYFPVTLSEALQFDCIILGAIDAHALGYEGCLLLRDYVRNGGSLFVLGGLYSWGGGRFREMGLDSFLPLTVTGTFDLAEGARYPVTVENRRILEVFRSIPPSISDWGTVNWFHILNTTPRTRILARVGDFPLLAVSTLGKGRIACMAGTTLGTDEPKDRPFWSSPGWNATRDILIRWLLHEKDPGKRE